MSGCVNGPTPGRKTSMAKHRQSSRARRSGLLIGLAIATSVALSACGASGSSSIANLGTTTSSPPAGGSATSTSAVGFSQCMRSNGVVNYPDPNSSGQTPKESPSQLGVSDATFTSAHLACQHLLPNGGNGPSQAQLQHVKELGLEFAHCMRSHGVPLPDPDGSGRIPDPASVGINQGSPKFQSANNACATYRPPYMPSNAQYNAYVRSSG
jgi:hypothetical protein